MPIYQRIRGEPSVRPARRQDIFRSGVQQPGRATERVAPTGFSAGSDQAVGTGHPAFSYLYEVKYLVETSRIPQIEAALDDLLRPAPGAADDKGCYNHSIYFDSPAYRAHNAARNGERVTVTPRIRAYRPTPGTPARSLFLELKRRYGGVIAKRRTAIDPELAGRLLANPAAEIGAMTSISSALAEFRYLVQCFDLRPSLAVLYHRDAFFAGPGQDVRVTFDRLVQYCPATSLDVPIDEFSCAMPPDQVVLEVKYGEDAPDGLLDRLRHLGLRAQSFSKLDSARAARARDLV